jgi:hypothetical protein
MTPVRCCLQGSCPDMEPRGLLQAEHTDTQSWHSQRKAGAHPRPRQPQHANGSYPAEKGGNLSWSQVCSRFAVYSYSRLFALADLHARHTLSFFHLPRWLCHLVSSTGSLTPLNSNPWQAPGSVSSILRAQALSIMLKTCSM